MKPSLPQGTRDFGPQVVRKRQYIFNIIRNIFELYGFQPLETPAMENLDTLMGKYGEEGDKLIFRILDSGNPFSKEFFTDLGDYFKFNYEQLENHRLQYKQTIGEKNPFGNALWEINPFVLAEIADELLNNKKYLSNFKKEVSSKALKYDLTIPFARYVAMNHGKLTFPFKRYQIQPVWRADKPQKGRYREFYQCDADIVGSNALINEIEFINIYNDVFTKLGISNSSLQINNRKILRGIMEICEVVIKEKEILVIIDKTDKIGIDGVKEELSKENIAEEKLTRLLEVYSLKGSNKEIILFLKKFLAKSTIGLQGVSELEFISNYSYEFTSTDLQTEINIDLTLARGLEYYTGIIFEAKAPPTVKIGSIGGGGRYDDLTGLFGLPNIPGVGISFGVDRIYDVLEELDLFPKTVEGGTSVLFFNLGEEESKTAYRLLQQLRKRGIASEMFHEEAKPEKQFKWAEKKGIPFVVLIGSKELESNTCVLKNIKTGVQKIIHTDELPLQHFEG